MNRIDVQEKLSEAFENGSCDDSVLCDTTLTAPRSALAEQGGALSSSSLELLIRQLVDTVHLDSQDAPTSLKAVFSYDGGMELSLYGSWGVSPTGGAFLDFLKPAKKQAVDSGKAVPVVYCGRPFWLLPVGVRSGLGSYSYVLIYEEEGREKYRFLLHTTPTSKIAGIRVLCRYQAFRHDRTLSDLRADLLDFVQAFGYCLDKPRLSRIDFNITINQPISNLFQAIKEDRVINRCPEMFLGGGRKSPSSFRVGSRQSIQFAAYDKIKELTDKYDADKINDLTSFFRGDLSDNWTRYEFRCSRSFLHACGIDTLQDYIDNEVAIVNYLTYSWFSVLDTKYRNGKKKHYKVSRWWLQVRLCFLIAVLSKSFRIDVNPLKIKGLKGAELRKYVQALNLNIIGRCEKIDSSLPIVSRRPKRRFRKAIKRLSHMAVGCLASMILLSLPSDSMMSKSQYCKSIDNAVSLYLDESYDSYCKKWRTIGPYERDYDHGFIDDVLELQGGFYHA